MANILHRIGIKSATIEEVYQYLTQREKLAGWWTDDTRGEGGQIGNLLHFHFGDDAFEMKVIDLKEPSYVSWEVMKGPKEWVGTTISFELKQNKDYVIVLFKHLNWKEEVEFMHHCSTKWAIFLMSLKSLLETGKGAPNPADIKIDNWN